MLEDCEVEIEKLDITESDNMEMMREAAGEKAARPMLLSDCPLARIRRLLAERENSYSKSDLVVNTEILEPEAVAKKIIERLAL